MKNNIKEILRLKDMSVNELSRLIEKDYSTTHALVNRENLGTTQLDTLVKVANVLDVDIKLLYSDKAEEIEVLSLLDKNYCGGLSVLALREYKKKIESEIKNKLNRQAILIYEYNSRVNMSGVEDELKLEFIIGNRKSEDDRYFFHFTSSSVKLFMRSDLIRSIENFINEYEKGEHEDIEKLYNDLNNENMYPCLMKLEKIEIRKAK